MVMRTNRQNITIVVDWDVKPQSKQKKSKVKCLIRKAVFWGSNQVNLNP